MRQKTQCNEKYKVLPGDAHILFYTWVENCDIKKYNNYTVSIRYYNTMFR